MRLLGRSRSTTMVASTPCMSSRVGRELVTPRPDKMSLILPMSTTPGPRSASIVDRDADSFRDRAFDHASRCATVGHIGV